MGVGEIGRVVADMHLDAHGAQAPDIGAFGGVAALNLVAQIVHDLGDAAHADAANADEMNGADIQRDAGGNSHQAALLLARFSTTSASFSAAWGTAMAWAQAARRARSRGSAKILTSIWAKT